MSIEGSGSEASVARTTVAFTCFSPSDPKVLLQQRRRSISQNATRPSRQSMCDIFSGSGKKDKNDKKKKKNLNTDENRSCNANDASPVSQATQSSYEDLPGSDTEEGLGKSYKQYIIRYSTAFLS